VNLKELIILIWKFFVFLKVLIFAKKSSKNDRPKVFYGGARKGDIGGPMVKIKKLSRNFKDSNTTFNIAYLTSNNSFLNRRTLDLLKHKKIPIILNQNGVYYPAWYEGNYKEKNHINSYYYKKADYVLYQSIFCKKASEKFLGKRTGAGEILYNAVDTNYFKPLKKISNKDFTFLLTGNIRKKNNYRISSVLYALKGIINEYKYKNININIAGYIEDKNYFKRIIYDLKLENNVNFLGRYSQENAPEIYSMADAYITMSYNDNCPSAVIEAMSSGLPILYSASGGIPELVTKECGIGLSVLQNWDKIIIPEVEDIKKGMHQIIENRNQIAKAARLRAINYFDIKVWINRHKEIFEKLLAQNYE
tara:strand:- start:1232 stop:2320 length:1089 start_codon:yes stop_codon:yes gene_type:complete